MSTFNPARLTLARRRRGLTKVALGTLVNLSSRRISAIENEGEHPSEASIQAFSEALGFPADFFFLGHPRDVSGDCVSFRSFSRLAASRRDAALAAAAMAVEVATWIEDRFHLPDANVLDLRDVDPATAASVLRSEWTLGNDPAPNLIHLLEAHGVRVYSLTDDCASLDAFSLWSDDTPFVFLTHHKSPERSRWDAAHELGHLVLHACAPPQGREHENEADEFAAQFLLPEDGVRASAPPYPALPEVRREKVRWRVAAVAYVRRLHQLGLISDWQYRSLMIDASQAGYRRHESDIERETSQIMPKVLDLLGRDGLSLPAVARELRLPPSELRGLLFSVASVIDGSAAEEPGTTQPRRHLRVV